MHITIARLAFTLILTGLLSFETASANKLIEFRRAEAWDIRCATRDASEQVVCDLYLVINYKPHPDFRAIVMMIFPEGAQRYRIQLDTEAQTALGTISTDSLPTLSLQGCDSPCVLTESAAHELLTHLLSTKTTMMEIRDYFVQSFEFEIDKDGFNDGLRWVNEMQSRYR